MIGSVAAVFAILIGEMATYEKETTGTIERTSGAVFVSLYVGLPLALFVSLRSPGSGNWGLAALLFLVMGVSFVLDPVAGAEQVSVSPLGADGLNTIRGDLGGLFLSCTVLLILGIVRSEGHWLLAVAVLMIVIAAGRLVGFVVDGAPSEATLTAFGFEIAIAAGLYYASRRLAAPA